MKKEALVCSAAMSNSSEDSSLRKQFRTGSPSEDPSNAERITSALDHFSDSHVDEHLQIQEVLGRGGYGTVYRGRWRNLAVAVKIVVFQGVQASEKAMQQAKTEASIAYNLAHANIVATYSHELKPICNENSALACWRLCLIQVKLFPGPIYLFFGYFDHVEYIVLHI